MTFERKIGRLLRDWNKDEELGGELKLGQWFNFTDENGRGFAQPDGYLILPDLVLIFECKLTQSDGAETQVMDLYKPLVEMVYERKVVCCQVYKNIRYEVENMIEHPKELLTKEGYWQWHQLV